MSRINGVGGTFPYAENNIEAPISDGIISSLGSADSPYIPFENGISTYPGQERKDAGVVKQYIGDTYCVDTNTTWHAVLVGDF
jgi:hypothetical protein